MSKKSVREAIFAKPTISGFATIGGKTVTILPAGTQYQVAPPSPALAGKIATKAVQEALKADPYVKADVFTAPSITVARAYGVLPRETTTTLPRETATKTVKTSVSPATATTFSTAEVPSVETSLLPPIPGGGGSSGGDFQKKSDWLLPLGIGLLLIGVFSRK